MRIASLLSLFVIVAACSPRADANAPLSAATIDSVKAVDAAFAAAMNAKDSTAVFAVYAADARVMPPDSPTLEGTAFHPAIAGMIADGASDFALTPTYTYGVGDLAYSVGTASFKAGGATQSIKYTEVLRRGADGKWRYVVDMFSGVTPPPPAAAAKKK